MVDAPGYIAPTPSREPAIDVFYVDGGYSGSSSAPPRKPTVDVFYVDGGCSWISISTFQGGHHRYFLTLMVNASEFTALAPLRELDIYVS
jgi:hypothetical protein